MNFAEYLRRNMVVSQSRCVVTLDNTPDHRRELERLGIPHDTETDIEGGTVRAVFTGHNAIDLLGKVPHVPEWRIVVARPADANIPKLLVRVDDDRAVIPNKTRLSDVGFDVTIVRVHKKLSDVVTMYDTGISVSTDQGFYLEMVPRSSLIKSGYMLANSVGIIDPSYTGPLLVALAKIDPSAPDLELPFTCCQLIVRRQEHAFVHVTREPPARTTRNDGGFGSTDIKK